MAINRQTITAEQFETLINLPENADKLFEFIGGEMLEVPSNPYASYIASKILGYLFIYLVTNDIGWTTTEAGGYVVAGEKYAPDVAFVSYTKQKKPAKQGYNPNPPDLAVEVVSAESRAENDKLTIKLGNYLSVDTIVWIVRPEKGSIEVHQSGQKVQTYRRGDVIRVDELLPNFELVVDKVLDDPDEVE